MENSLSCSLSFLLWGSQVNGKPCSGPIVGIGLLNDLVNTKFVGSDKRVYNTAHLLLNRISPYPLRQENVAGLDVCKSHLDWLTVSHPSMKQTSCCFLISGGEDKLTKCNKKASRRVTFALSKALFSSHFQHAPVGSGLCDSHRKTLSKNKTLPGEISQTMQGDISQTMQGGISQTMQGSLSQTMQGDLSQTMQGDLSQTLQGDISQTEHRDSDQTMQGGISQTKLEDFDRTADLMTNSRPKRKLLLDEKTKIPELKKSFSVTSDSQELEPASQSSNFSDQSDIEVKRVVHQLDVLKKVHRLEKLQTLCSEVGLVFPGNINFPLKRNVIL